MTKYEIDEYLDGVKEGRDPSGDPCEDFCASELEQSLTTLDWTKTRLQQLEQEKLGLAQNVFRLEGKLQVLSAALVKAEDNRRYQASKPAPKARKK